MDLKDIKAIIDLMKKNSLSEFELEKQDFKIKLKRGGSGIIAAPMDEGSGITYALPAPVQIAQPTSVSAAAAPAASSGNLEIKSPMIGTFYRSPSPESDEYVEIGTEVNVDTVDASHELRKGIELRLGFAPVVTATPIAHELLDLRKWWTL